MAVSYTHLDVYKRQEYHFVTEEDFQKLKAAGKIIEDRGYETVYGLSLIHILPRRP